MVEPDLPFHLPGPKEDTLRTHSPPPDSFKKPCHSDARAKRGRRNLLPVQVEILPCWGAHFSRPLRESPAYFFPLRRTGFRKTSHASRYFSYFDRFFRLTG